MLHDHPSDVWLLLERLQRRLGRLAGGRQAGVPGSLGLHLVDQLDRLQRLRSALLRSRGIARDLIAQRLAGLDFTTIGPILLQACEDIALCYGGSMLQRGVREAWGSVQPVHDWRSEHPHAGRYDGNVSFAANDLAAGHVLLIGAVLSALMAYLTRGKGDRAQLLDEIRRSPRLGPKVADWLVLNEGKLVTHPSTSG